MVSQLCLGTMNFGNRIDEPTSRAILDRFTEAGGTFLDTADAYNQWTGKPGDSESLIGRWMAERGNRDDLVIATKGGAVTTVPDDPREENFEGLGAGTVRRAAEDSLRRLGVDHVDLYYAHYDDRRPDLAETVGALGKLVGDGLASRIGCSNYATWRMERARAIAAQLGVEPYSAIQQEYTYLWPKPGPAPVVTAEMLDYLTVHPDISLLAYSPLLAGGYSKRPIPADRGYAHPSAFGRFQVLREVAAELGATPNQVALAWLLHHKPAAVPVFGASSVAQLDEALGALDLSLDRDLMDRLDRA
jgi:aryl-alcohol dehydrogenase-like predicted oxidoreductase